MPPDPLGPRISGARNPDITGSQHRQRTFKKSPALLFFEKMQKMQKKKNNY